jgi:hypothetical protein
LEWGCIENPGEAEDIELLNSDKSSWLVKEIAPVVAYSLLLSKGIHPALPKETVIVCPEAVYSHDNTVSLGIHQSLPCASKHVVTLMSHQVTTDEVQSVAHEEVH